MNTWFSVHKDEQFLEDHDLLNKHLEVLQNNERRKGSKRELEFQLGIFIETAF